MGVSCSLQNEHGMARRGGASCNSGEDLGLRKGHNVVVGFKYLDDAAQVRQAHDVLKLDLPGGRARGRGEQAGCVQLLCQLGLHLQPTCWTAYEY